MRFVNGQLTVSPTDLANFLACRHKTALDLRVARGELSKPQWKDPLAEVLYERGNQHERRYIDRLRHEGLTIVDLNAADRDDCAALAIAAMRDGVDVIVQAGLQDAQWNG